MVDFFQIFIPLGSIQNMYYLNLVFCWECNDTPSLNLSPGPVGLCFSTFLSKQTGSIVKYETSSHMIDFSPKSKDFFLSP